MQEHSNGYDYLAKILNKNSYQVYCLNHYGQGNNVTNNDIHKRYMSKIVTFSINKRKYLF